MVKAVRTEFGRPGIAGQIGRLREWTDISGGPKNGIITRLTAEPTADGTRITLSQTAREVVLGLTIAQGVQWTVGLVFGALAVTGVEPDLFIPMGILIGIAVLLGVGTQIGMRLWHRQQAGQFEALLDRLELAARDAAPLPEDGRAAEAAETSPRLDLDGLPDAPAADGAADRRRQRT